MFRILTTLLIGGLVLFGCSDDPTASDDPDTPAPPGEPLPRVEGELTALADVVGTEVGRLDRDGPWIECTFVLRATYVGLAGTAGLVQHAVLRFHPGPDRAVPVDSGLIGEAQLREGFGGRWRIEPGDTLASAWSYRAPTPHGVTGTLLWNEYGGETREAPFAFTCGPELTEEAPPVLSDVQLSVSSDSIEAGTGFDLAYHADSELGLWETHLIVTGPDGANRTVIVEALRDEVTRVIPLRHPRGSANGSRLRIQLVTYDAWLRPDSSEVFTSPAVYDTQPPFVERFSMRVEGPCYPRACQFGSDSTIAFGFTASDGGGLAYAFIEIGDPVVWRDSVAVFLPGGYRLPTPLGEIGTLDGVYPVRGSISDAAGNRSRAELGDINVYPSHGRARTTEVLLDSQHVVVPDFESGRMYVLPTAGPIVVYDIESLTPTGEIAGPAMPGPADLMPDGRLVVGHGSSDTIGIGYGSVAVDTLVLDRAGLAADLRLSELVTTAAGTIVAVLQSDSGSTAAVEADPVTGAQRTILEFADGSAFTRMRLARSGDGTRLVIYFTTGCARLYEVAAQTLAPCATVPATLSGDMTGERWTTSSTLYDASLNAIASLEQIAGYPARPGPAGYSYVAARRGLLRYDEATGLIRTGYDATEYADSERYTTSRLHLSPDGTLALIWGRPRAGSNPYATMLTIVRLDGGG